MPPLCLHRCFPSYHLPHIFELKGNLTHDILLVLLFVQLLLTTMKTLGSHHIRSLFSNWNIQVLWVSYFQSNLQCSPNSLISPNRGITAITVKEGLLLFFKLIIRDFCSALAQNTDEFGRLLLLKSPLLRSISNTYHIYQSSALKYIFYNLVCKNIMFFLALYMNIKEHDHKLHKSNYPIIQELLAFLFCFKRSFLQVSTEIQHLFMLPKYLSQGLLFRYLLIWWVLVTYSSEKKTQSPFFYVSTMH